MKRTPLAILGLSCLIALSLTVYWLTQEPPQTVEACDSCDSRHQRLKLKAADEQ